MRQCLVVDDSRVVRKVTRAIIEPLGFAVTEAENGWEALQSCQEVGLPELVMLDWNMPVMNGIEFCRKLRALPGGGNPKVIFCTTENEMPSIQLAMEAGADEYIMKPYDDEVVRNKLVTLGMIDE